MTIIVKIASALLFHQEEMGKDRSIECREGNAKEATHSQIKAW